MLRAGAEASRTGKSLKDTLVARTLKRVREGQAGQGAPVAEEYKRETKKPKIPPFLGSDREGLVSGEAKLPPSSNSRHLNIPDEARGQEWGEAKGWGSSGMG